MIPERSLGMKLGHELGLGADENIFSGKFSALDRADRHFRLIPESHHRRGGPPDIRAPRHKIQIGVLAAAWIFVAARRKRRTLRQQDLDSIASAPVQNAKQLRSKAQREHNLGALGVKELL